MSGPYATFILMAYSAAIIVLACLIAWIALDYRALRRTLTDFEERGLTRRSDTKPRA